MHSQAQAANETVQEYIPRCSDLVIHTTGTDPTVVTCQVTIVLFIRYLFNKKIKKQVAEVNTIQTVRHTVTLVQDAEIKFKKYEG